MGGVSGKEKSKIGLLSFIFDCESGYKIFDLGGVCLLLIVKGKEKMSKNIVGLQSVNIVVNCLNSARIRSGENGKISKGKVGILGL